MIRKLIIMAMLLLAGCASHKYKTIEFFKDTFTFEYEMTEIDITYEREVHKQEDYTYVSPAMELGQLPDRGAYRVELYDQEAIDTLFHPAFYDKYANDWERIKKYEGDQYLGVQEESEDISVAGSDGLLTIAHAEGREKYKYYSLWVKGDNCCVHVVLEGWMNRDAIDHIAATWEWE